jgi:hypothetical protein
VAAYALRAPAPVQFWVHRGLHALFAARSGALTVALARAAGWQRRKG